MAYEYVKAVAGDNPKLKIIYERLEKMMVNKLNEYDLKVEVVPEELEYIIEEESLVLFNRVGSEGVKSERVGSGGVTVDYGDSYHKVFSLYEDEIISYVNSKTEEDNSLDITISFI